MIANQTLIAPDGFEVALFPMPYLYMTQDEGGDYSHLGTYNIDFVGYNGSAVITNAPVYAPCTMKVVYVDLSYNGGNGVGFESVNKVHLPNGALEYLSFYVAHANNPPYTTIGTVVSQGQLCYYTGSYGQVTGDHVHSCLGQGTWQGLTQRSSGNWDLANRIHYWDGVYINDTTIIMGYGHNWQTYNVPPSPSRGKQTRKGFPFVLYARKLRNKY